MIVVPGNPIPIALQMADGNPSVFPRAYLYYPDFQPYSTPYVDLTPQTSDGLYGNESVAMPTNAIIAVFKVYEDSGHTTLDSDYDIVEDSYEVSPSGGGGGASGVSGVIVLKGKVVTPKILKGKVISPAILRGKIYCQGET